MVRGKFSYVLEVRSSYGQGLVLLRLGVRNSYGQG